MLILTIFQDLEQKDAKEFQFHLNRDIQLLAV